MSRNEIRTEHIVQLRRLAEGTALSAKAQKKLGAILRYLESDVSMDEAAKASGITASALRRWIDAFDPEHPESLEDKSRKPLTVRTTDIADETAALIRSYRQESPRMGKEEIAKKLLERGENVSASAIGRYIERECLYFADCPLHRRKRLHAALRASGAREDIRENIQDDHVATTVLAVRTRPGGQWHAAKRWIRSGLFLALLLFPTMNAFAITYDASNNEFFETIDDWGQSSGTDKIGVRFGALLQESLVFDQAGSTFVLSDDLNVQGTISGSHLKIAGTASISGALLLEGDSTLSGSALRGFGLDTDCDNATTSKLLWDAATGRFSCGTDQGGGGGLSLSDADARYVNRSGDSMTGALTIQNGNAHVPTTTPLVNVRGTISGAFLRASNMTVSGAIVYSSGNTLLQTAKGASGQVLLSQGTAAPKWSDPVGGMIWYFDDTQAVETSRGPQITMPMSLNLTSISLSAKGAPTGAALIYDISLNGTTIFATRPQIDAGATTGGGSAVFSTTNIPANSVLTIDIDQVGSTFAGSGVTIMLKGVRKY